MNLSFRTALLLMAALSASSVAPAQVSPGSEPLLEVGSNKPAAMIVPATLKIPEVANLLSDAPEASGTVSSQSGVPTALDEQVTATGDLNEMVSELRATNAGSSELECLAGAIYFESKSEPLKGQLAVGHVIANRTHSGRFPSSYCGVVYQRSQFSFVHGHSMPPIARSGLQWKNAVAIAHIVDRHLQPTPVANSLFFHARSVSPSWHLTRVATLGNHVFYR